MEYLLIGDVRNISYEDSDRGFDLGGYFISHNKNKLNEFLSNPFARQSIGEIAVDSLVRNYNISFYKAISDNSEVDFGEMGHELSSPANGCLHALWFAKDCSVFVGGYFIHIINVGTIETSYNIRYSNAAGGSTSTHFTKQDIEHVTRLHAKIIEICGVRADQIPAAFIKEDIQTVRNSTLNSVPYTKDINRIFRAYLFLQRARLSSFLPGKIAYYIAILECLFNTGPDEVSSKVAMRTALYIGSDITDRLEINNKVAAAYGIRSQFWHGQAISDKKSDINELAKISIAIDEIVRKILTKVLSIDSELFLNESLLTSTLKEMPFL